MLHDVWELPPRARQSARPSSLEISRDPRNNLVSRLLDLGLIDLLEGKRYAWGDDFRPHGKYQHLILDFAVISAND